MSSSWAFLIGLILLIIWVVTGGYVTQAEIYLKPYKNKDDDFATAYHDTYRAAFITWLLVGIFVLLLILSVLGIVALFGSGAGEVAEGAEAAEGVEVEAESVGRNNNRFTQLKPHLSWLTIIFLIGALFLVVVTGLYAANAARHLKDSSNFDSNNSKMEKAYTNCRTAAILCLGSAGTLIVGFIVYLAVEQYNKRRREEQVKAARARREQRGEMVGPE